MLIPMLILPIPVAFIIDPITHLLPQQIQLYF
ncbi:hypothetical protein Xhom_02729 [Xenorhabdus hominickii]|uniref:Uncharacterized protein n=1 Tax=Xenorhabdus hominickii TaxID=351679 RepID=A0A2G0Q6E6_XENHO|nr:hypothetical protein Xhom_02729 [Xenorhabdus hominickii]